MGGVPSFSSVLRGEVLRGMGGLGEGGSERERERERGGGGIKIMSQVLSLFLHVACNYEIVIERL